MLTDSSWPVPHLVEATHTHVRSHRYGVGTPGGIVLTDYRVTHAGSFGVHVERELHQLTWLSGSTLGVFADDDFIIVPSSQAIWIPAGTVHDIATYGSGRLFCVYFRADAETLPLTSPRILEVDELVRGLLLHLASGLAEDAGLRARQVLLDALSQRVSRTAQLPMPVDPRARAVADRLLDDPVEHASLDEHATQLGMSARTIRRKFLAETGLTYREWATRSRLVLSLPMLDSNRPLAEIGMLVGYETQTGYIAAFRAHFGLTPGAYRSHVRAEALATAAGTYPQIADGPLAGGDSRLELGS